MRIKILNLVLKRLNSVLSKHLLISALHCRHRPSEVELLFQLLRVFTIRHVPDFHFLRKFLDETVAKVGVFFPLT